MSAGKNDKITITIAILIMVFACVGIVNTVIALFEVLN